MTSWQVVLLTGISKDKSPHRQQLDDLGCMPIIVSLLSFMHLDW
jgi:hypothetical protein